MQEVCRTTWEPALTWPKGVVSHAISVLRRDRFSLMEPILRDAVARAVGICPRTVPALTAPRTE